jgi:hypothetical protein
MTTNNYKVKILTISMKKAKDSDYRQHSDGYRHHAGSNQLHALGAFASE